MRLACLAVAALVASSCSRSGSALPNIPIVTYDDGRGIVLGRRLTSAGMKDGAAPRDYAAFWGVPYAEPPVGALRFKPPVGARLPDGVVQAGSVSAPCLQQRRHPPAIKGSEDCLTLHIFTPHLGGPDLPVVVFFHGGAFMYGDAPRTGAEYVMDNDLVMVTVDYRLGILGFLSFEDEELPGNLGLLDQVEALRWVQENIHLFGGNNKSVTISGNSAGSASCLLHTLSPLSQGLFHKVIGSSGSPLNPWTQQYSAREKALHVARLANCSANATDAIIACLQGKTAVDLVALEAEHFQFWNQNPFSPFAPVVDTAARTPFLPRDPQDMLASGEGVADVPLLLGVTDEEGLYVAGEFLANSTLLEELDAQWETAAPLLLHFNDSRVSDEEKPQWARKIRQHYLKNASLAEGTRELVQLMGDRNFVSGVATHAVQRAAHQSTPVYLYRFGYRGEFSLYNGIDAGASHADDMQYVFVYSRWSGPFSRPGDVLMCKRMQDMWASFVNNSVPEMHGVTSWTAVTKSSDGVLSYMNISGPVDMAMAWEKDMGRSSFWRSLEATQQWNHSGRVQISPSVLLATLCFVVLIMSSSS